MIAYLCLLAAPFQCVADFTPADSVAAITTVQ